MVYKKNSLKLKLYIFKTVALTLFPSPLLEEIKTIDAPPNCERDFKVLSKILFLEFFCL